MNNSNNILLFKICKHHGELNKDDIYIQSRVNRSPVLCCRICKEISRTKYHNKTLGRAKILNYESHIKRKFNLTIEQFNTMKTSQNNLCLICKHPEAIINKKTNLPMELSIDHCHSTGKVRGLLCKTCNLGLGYFNDNPKLLEQALNYLSIKQ